MTDGRAPDLFDKVRLPPGLAAHKGSPAYLFFDEVQNLHAWAAQLKALFDHHTAHVVATGSSALRIEAGRESLAGRVTVVDLGTLRHDAGRR